jgi:hypothetical protein
MKAFLLPISLVVGAFLAGVMVGYQSIPHSAPIASAKTAVVPPKSDTGATREVATAGDAPAVAPPSTQKERTIASATDLIGELKNALAHSSSRRAYATLSTLVNSIGPANVREVVNFAQSLSKQQDKNSLAWLVFARWAEFNPTEAINFAQSMPAGPDRDRAVSSAVSAWAENDAAAVLAWAPTNGTEPDA